MQKRCFQNLKSVKNSGTKINRSDIKQKLQEKKHQLAPWEITVPATHFQITSAPDEFQCLFQKWSDLSSSRYVFYTNAVQTAELHYLYF